MPILSVQSAAHRLISWLPGLPVLAFLIRNVFVAAVVPKMAAGCSPEVTFVSVHRATPSWSEDEKRIKYSKPQSYCVNGKHLKLPSEWFLPGSGPCLLCDRGTGLQRDRDDPLRAPVGIPHH